MPTPTAPSPTARRVLVIGANGRFGLAAAQAFAAAGWQVLAQVRRAAAPGMPAHAQLVRAPLADPAALAREAGPVDVLVYAANPLYTQWEKELLPMARAGMGLAETLGALFVLPGNVYDFGEQMPATLDEATPFRPSTRKGELRVLLAQELRRRAPRLRSLVLRAGDFFGSGTGNWFDLVMVKSIARGKLVYPGPVDRVHAWTYLPDMARALVALCDRPLQGHTVVHAPSLNLTGTQMLDALERAARTLAMVPATPFRRGGMPWGVIRLAGLVVPMWKALAEMSYLWRTPHALESTRLQALLPGFTHTPLDEALLRTLRELSATGPAARSLPARTPSPPQPTR